MSHTGPNNSNASQNNDPLLANLNAFKNKVKSAPVISRPRPTAAAAGTVVGGSTNNITSPLRKALHDKKRSIELREQEERERSSGASRTNTPGTEPEVLEIDSSSDNEGMNGNGKVKSEHTDSTGSPPPRKKVKKEEGDVIVDGETEKSDITRSVTGTPIIDLNGDSDDDEVKEVRPGSIAAHALQANQSNISKSHDSSKLLWATEYIQKKGKPVAMNELMDYLSLKPNDKVIELLKKLEKISFDPKKNAFKYVSTYDVHSEGELIKLLRSQVTFKGISCKELKDGWPQCDETINELEEESKILVLRTKKDRTPRYVWYNNGGDLHRIDEEFIKMWENVQLPQFSELPRKLQDLGLKPASVDPATIKRQTRVEVKKKKQRRGKITNTHMAGILKDFSHRV
ncbi:transcription factor TFIIE subunit TFA2 NDAI_0A01070 [Naumovozyma dairenensis CBS 421]|uniref:TFIIE beta domain-containing protein n=1 Tax=Naumovozyma dairenensis (strain ATCC 10597 / BCRC 20456 / CBS 421 / NBRC 0211 / NRRL Y-12639) TaxID=1071378 RepID=G0W377_NAUDC|nr:hypothetical protein NDAI_0A01070 [Naumovozyma dairenensis CBS 421]CCD22265.1 hypothetical protein NDAI_0A01070 [Naumovozyma dairenensis CBS 421]